MSLFEDLCEIAENIKKHRNAMNGSEVTTEQVSIEPFIDALGYDTQNPAEVRKQYVILNSDAVDFAVLRDGAPIIVLEGKKASEKLSHKHWKQLFEYFNADKARIGILTNGIAYRFYTDMDKSNIMDKEPFLKIDLLDLDKQTVEILEGFTKAQFDPIKSIRYMKIRAKVGRILNYPDEWLVRHVIYNIHKGKKTKKVIEEYRPLVKRAIDEYADREVARRGTEPETCTSDGYIPIYGYRDGHRFEAELSLDSVRKGIFLGSKAVRYKGKLIKASHAVWLAIRSVDETFDSKTWNKEKINSWRFWHVVDPLDGSEREMRLVAGWKDNRDEALYKRILSS